MNDGYMDLWNYDRERWDAGTVCGCDEAGAGPLAGPVYAAAVILSEPIPGLDDSKKLTAKRREALYDVITARALCWAVARVEAAEIDETDILSARLKAMQTAVNALFDRTPLDLSSGTELSPGVTAAGGAPLRPRLALVDGNRDVGKHFSFTYPHELLVSGDSLSASVAAASVLAKVSRDCYVVDVLDKEYPQYQFAKHKGYGTALHYAMLNQYGPCPEHRKTFLRKWTAKRGSAL